jgi:DNA polymerase-3 subunit delta
MIFFLFGEDTYRSRQKLRDIVNRYQKIHKTGLNLSFLDGIKLDFQDCLEKFRAVPMFREKKLVIIRNIFPNSEFKEKFIEKVKEFKNSKNMVLFYENGVVPKNDAFLKILKNQGEFQEFEPLKGERLRKWAKKEIENYGKKIDYTALSQLIFYIGSDLWRFSNEIKKLVSYQLKCRNIEISSKEVEILVRPKIETDIFRTIDALALRDKKQALCFIYKHLEKGDYPLYLLTMINFQFRNLLMLKSRNQSDGLTKDLGMHPYTVMKAARQSEKFSLDELKKIYQKIFQADLDIKTGKIEPETALDLLIAEI